MNFYILFLTTSVSALDRTRRDIAGQNRLANNCDRHMLARRQPAVIPSYDLQIASVLNLRKRIASWAADLKKNDVRGIRRVKSVFNVLSCSQSPTQDPGQSRRLSRFLHHGRRF